MTEDDAWTGILLGDRYELREPLNEGGMGRVYRAWDRHALRSVAAKIAQRDREEVCDTNVRRLQREAVVLATLRHPRIVRIFDSGFVGNEYYAVLEYLRGRTLDAVMEDRRQLGIAASVQISLALLDGLEAVHAAGLVHRDIKPDNVILTPDGLKIIDFGLAILEPVYRAERLTNPGMAMGTPRYMAPEQCLGLPVDARADLYACGQLLYMMLTGTHPLPFMPGENLVVTRCYHPARPFIDTAPDLKAPEGLEAVVLRALHIRPDHRFRNVREMREALLAAVP